MFRICVRIRIHGLTPRFSPRLGSFSHTPLAHLRGCPSVFAEFSRLKGGFIPTARCFFFGFIVKSPNVRINVRVFVRNIACQNRHWYEYVQIYVRICVRLYRLHVRVYVRVNTYIYNIFQNILQNMCQDRCPNTCQTWCQNECPHLYTLSCLSEAAEAFSSVFRLGSHTKSL